jgi:hypothetical protein
MTTMATTPLITLPDPNNADSLQQHKEQVLAAYAPVFALIEAAVRDSVPRATNWFRLLNGPVDLGVHAAITRYLTRLSLSADDVEVEDEDALSFELDRVPNCGLCVRGGEYEIRILKNSADGIPKATSEARSRFYSSNQFQFSFAGQRTSHGKIPLSLLVLWKMDSSYSYAGLEIACPRGERKDGTVDCYWITTWSAGQRLRSPTEQGPGGTNGDLDEIKLLTRPKTASS